MKLESPIIYIEVVLMDQGWFIFLPTDLFREGDGSPPLVGADFIICSYGLFICLHIYANNHNVFELK